ncbi:hypothetical protein [Ochrovirga pacifica]|uniref:hypothetical protein n=1 Tax=Ochrovirga pacifica TaxID=1042376 RepID=UPI000255A24B|nr:hypothetical protein [Ochrovirga pacifica]
MKKILLIGIIAGIFSGCKTVKTTTNNIINEELGYYPLKTGNYWIHKYFDSNNTQTIKVVDKNIEINGKHYFKIERKYSWNKKSVDYSRNEKGTNYSYDDKTKGESINIPNNLEVGFTWLQFDKSWKYEIISTNAKIETPIGKYENLLLIEASQLTNRDKYKRSKYQLFFKRGVGKIAAKGNGKLMTYLTKYNVQ